MDPLVIEFDVACTAAHAFTVWTTATSSWWPTAHTVSGERGVAVQFEPRVGGRIFERTTTGTEHDWGEIVVWEPPGRLVYTWHLGSERAERADATEVEITFAQAGAETAVRIEHRGWERFGSEAEDRRAGNRRGWGGVIPMFIESCNP